MPGFGGGRHAAQSETKTGRAFVHGAVLREPRIFGVLHHRQVQFGAEAQRGAHHFVVKDRLAIVGNSHCARPLQGSKISECRTARAARGSGDGEDVHHGAAFRMPQPRDPFVRIHHGHGIRHGADRGETSGGGGGSAARDRFLVALSWLAQVNVQSR